MQLRIGSLVEHVVHSSWRGHICDIRPMTYEYAALISYWDEIENTMKAYSDGLTYEVQWSQNSKPSIYFYKRSELRLQPIELLRLAACS